MRDHVLATSGHDRIVTNINAQQRMMSRDASDHFV
jgi:hypothetical protein